MIHQGEGGMLHYDGYCNQHSFVNRGMTRDTIVVCYQRAPVILYS